MIIIGAREVAEQRVAQKASSISNCTSCKSCNPVDRRRQDYKMFPDLHDDDLRCECFVNWTLVGDLG